MSSVKCFFTVDLGFTLVLKEVAKIVFSVPEKGENKVVKVIIATVSCL